MSLSNKLHKNVVVQKQSFILYKNPITARVMFFHDKIFPCLYDMKNIYATKQTRIKGSNKELE